MEGSALCSACADIFSVPRELGFAAPRENWRQTPASFRKALQRGCHLCHLMSHSASLSHLSTHNGRRPLIAKNFGPVEYSFRPVSTAWARRGVGHPLSAPAIHSWRIETGLQYLQAIDEQPEIQKLKRVVLDEPNSLVSGSQRAWIMLELMGSGFEINLPMEVWRGSSVEEQIQMNLFQQRSTGSLENLQLAALWLNNCKAHHPECQPLYADFKWLPTRLMDVGSLTCPQLRLVRGAELEPGTPYATLSHSWGADTGPALTIALLENFYNAVPLDVLSETMVNAVETCRHLELRYLWIDGLCIIQNDEDDWNRESITMSKVYGCSTCTIVATASEHGGGSMFRERNQFRVRPLKIPNPFRQKSQVAFQIHAQHLSSAYQTEVKQGHWHSRSWTFQERVLSQRLLIFGQHQMMWACQRLQAAECCPEGKSSKFFIDRFESFEAEKRRLRRLLDANTHPESAASLWNDLVTDYTSTTTSRSSDRLIALQGVANRIADAKGRPYVYGIWFDEHWPHALLWSTVTTIERPQESRAPTWSWGAVDGQVEYRCELNSDAIIKKTTIQPSFSNGGTQLMLTGNILPAVLEISSVENTIRLRRRLPVHAISVGESIKIDQARSAPEVMPSQAEQVISWGKKHEDGFWATSEPPELESVPVGWKDLRRPYVESVSDRAEDCDNSIRKAESEQPPGIVPGQEEAILDSKTPKKMTIAGAFNKLADLCQDYGRPVALALAFPVALSWLALLRIDEAITQNPWEQSRLAIPLRPYVGGHVGTGTQMPHRHPIRYARRTFRRTLSLEQGTAYGMPRVLRKPRPQPDVSKQPRDDSTTVPAALESTEKLPCNHEFPAKVHLDTKIGTSSTTDASDCLSVDVSLLFITETDGLILQEQDSTYATTAQEQIPAAIKSEQFSNDAADRCISSSTCDDKDAKSTGSVSKHYTRLGIFTYVEQQSATADAAWTADRVLQAVGLL